MMWSLRCSFIHSFVPLADADSVVCGPGSELGYRDALVNQSCFFSCGAFFSELMTEAGRGVLERTGRGGSEVRNGSREEPGSQIVTERHYLTRAHGGRKK